MFKSWFQHTPFWSLAVLCYVITILIGWSYGNSFLVYVTVTIMLALWVYYRFFTRFIAINQNIILIIKTILCVTFLMSLINGDIQSFVMVNISLILPLSLCTLNIDYSKFERQLIIASIINILLINILIRNFQVWNPNTLAFMIFCGISPGMLWFKISSKIISKLFSVLYLGVATSFLLLTGCRNAGMVIVACFILLILPSSIYKRGLIFRGLYITAMFLTIIAGEFMKLILSDAQLMNEVLTFTTSFSEKAWGMDTHYVLLEVITDKFQGFDIITQLFGKGIKTYHTHNLYYQCLFFYGYIGTFLIYIFYAYIFERAYKLIVENNDIISLSCFIILVGHFLLQIGEVYMLGAETANPMALLPVGVILQRWIKYRNIN